jgi:hypothetical protein
MCLMLVATTEAPEREKLAGAARKASATALRVEMEHPPRWPWARETPARATISEEGGCACSLLSDDADWNADDWAMRPEILEQLARTLQILTDEGPPNLFVEALSLGEAPSEMARVTRSELVELARSSRLGTRTRYEIVRRDKRTFNGLFGSGNA